MSSFLRAVLVVAFATAGVGLDRAAFAVAAQDTPAPGASPSPVPSVAPSGDSCGGRDRLLATLNRPTVGYSACAVPPGSIVLEEGYQNQSQAGASPNVTASYPQGFERFGIGGGFEADIIGPNDNRSRSGSTVATGYNDFGLGFKYELPQKGRFTYGLDGLFTAVTGTAGFTAGRPTQTGNLDVSYAASPAIAFGTTIAESSAGYLLPSVVASAQIPHDYQFYIELVAQTRLVPQGGGRIFTDFGVQKLVGQNVELDVEYAESFTPVEGSRFHYVGIGTGIRVK